EQEFSRVPDSNWKTGSELKPHFSRFREKCARSADPADAGPGLTANPESIRDSPRQAASQAQHEGSIPFTRFQSPKSRNSFAINDLRERALAKFRENQLVLGTSKSSKMNKKIKKMHFFAQGG